MKTFFTLSVLSCTMLTALAGAGWVCPMHQQNCPRTQHTGACAYYDAQPVPRGWKCPIHGKDCPWTKNHGYCDQFAKYGYSVQPPKPAQRDCCW